MNNSQPRPHVAMLLSNGYESDRRVQKEAHTLAAAGYRVTVIAWDRTCVLPVHVLEDAPPALAAALPARSPDRPRPVSVVRVQVPAGYGTGRSLLRRMPLFWGRALHELRRIRPTVVHAHDLDTLPLACFYGWWAHVPVVFDAHEFYPGMVRAHVGRLLSGILARVERALVPRAAAVLTVGARLADHYRSMGVPVTIVHNSHPLPDLEALNAQAQAQRRLSGVPEDDLLVVYVGMLTPDRLLAPVLAAVPLVEHAWLVVGGAGPQQTDVAAAAARCDRIRFLGWVPPDEVLPVVAMSDVVYYGLDAYNTNSPYFMPNLAFHALAAGRPLLVTPVGEIAEVVQQTGCGIVLESATSEAARRALDRLIDRAERVTLGRQARYICQEHYHWSYAAAQLLAVYRHILNATIIQD